MNLVVAVSRISTRERTMLAALVLVGILIWLSSLWRHWEVVGRTLRKARGELAQQAVWLDNAKGFEQELRKSLSQLDPKSTFDADALIARVDGLARKGALKLDLGTPSTVEHGVFLQHTLKVGIKNAPLARLIDFERGLRVDYPYATLEDFSISASKADPRYLNARLTVVAYQLKNGALIVDATEETLNDKDADAGPSEGEQADN